MRGGASTRDKADLATQPRRSVRRAEAVGHVPLAVDALMLAVWSPHGSQGRSTIAAALAHTFAKGLKLPGDVLLVDADTYAPAQHVLHGATEITAGILAAARLIRQERYSNAEHDRVTLSLHGYRLLTGVTAPERWAELDEHASTLLIHELGQRAKVTVFDIANELDAGIVEPMLGIRRNQVTLSVLQRADIVLAVAAADQVSIARLVNELPTLLSQARGRVILVINRMRTSAIGTSAKKQILEVLETLPSTTPLDVVFVPDDPRACDDALLAGEPVTAVRNRSGFAKGIRELASRINSTHVHTARAG